MEEVNLYKVQIGGCKEQVWSENQLTFATEEQAKQYAHDLLGRWTGADIARVVTSDVPVRLPIDLNDPLIVVNYRR